MYKKLLLFCLMFFLPAFLSFAQGVPAQKAMINSDINIYSADTVKGKNTMFVFVREGCSVCKKQEEFVANDPTIRDFFDVTFLDIGEPQNKKMWEILIEKNQLSKVTPITLVGGDVLVGFNEKTTSKKIFDHKDDHTQYDVSYYLGDSNVSGMEGDDASVCQVDSSASCSVDAPSDPAQTHDNIMTLPYFGDINVKETSLFLMASVLGFIDGFNPCAMWVLLTFLIILSQVGDKKKMISLAGIFILAEAVMYFMILNVWYQTWDFISLDQWVTPAVGILAIGSGIYFLYKAYKNKGKLTCNVTSFEHQQKTTQKIREAVSKPLTIITIIAVLGIAFSVNIIEFACSVGIAQSFTKIMEINALGFLGRQWYIFIYSLFYMADDFVVFALAIVGYQRFHLVGAKYSHLSTIVGGILMIVIGIFMTFFPNLLVF
jgi:cytochrome c biogenesis protein CcdA/thioredoxin-related protein